jgi:hypothetical protein
MILLTGILSTVVNADNKNDPEIVDPKEDVLLFGLTSAPRLNPYCKHVDVVSGWFHESSDEPDMLYATLKVNEYKPCKLLVAYAFFWMYNDMSYSAFAMIARGEDYLVGLQIQETNYIEVPDLYFINPSNNTITFAIPKDLIDDPAPGETLNNPFAIGAIRFVSENLASLLMRFVSSNILVADLTYEGLDYTIQY